MSKESTIANLLPEIYAATSYEEDKFKPMDPRRTRRLLRLDCDDTETINRGMAAMVISTDYRRKKQGKKKYRRK